MVDCDCKPGAKDSCTGDAAPELPCGGESAKVTGWEVVVEPELLPREESRVRGLKLLRGEAPVGVTVLAPLLPLLVLGLAGLPPGAAADWGEEGFCPELIFCWRRLRCEQV